MGCLGRGSAGGNSRAAERGVERPSGGGDVACESQLLAAQDGGGRSPAAAPELGTHPRLY
jgi:hypothetical protein